MKYMTTVLLLDETESHIVNRSQPPTRLVERAFKVTQHTKMQTVTVVVAEKDNLYEICDQNPKC